MTMPLAPRILPPRILAPSVAALLACLVACQPSRTPPPPAPAPASAPAPERGTVTVPVFNADTAYAFVVSQVKFGPRVPNSAGHARCGDWLIGTLRRMGAQVTVQAAEAKAFDGTPLRFRNIIASFAPAKPRRVMLSAHWDSRPFADHDPDPAKHTQPVLGANDGASGVAVLLEMARHLAAAPPEVGVDLMLWDAEDYGKDKAETYCLGSQHWARNPHQPGYMPVFGINLDMVGAANAQFRQEGYSMLYGAPTVAKVWAAASRIGHGRYFPAQPAEKITDDHLFVNQLAGISCIDVIDLQGQLRSSFFDQWHTAEDDLDVISRETLRAVGQTMLEVVYHE